jgi:hypothetical protein
MERRRFTREFKLEAVRLIRDRGVSYAQASECRPIAARGHAMREVHAIDLAACLEQDRLVLQPRSG